MPYTPILATLGYIMSPDGKQVLLVHRNKRPNDSHFGKYNGLGGKVQAGEDIVECLRREIREEADLECLKMILCGTVSWPGFGKQGEDWFGFVFRIETWAGTPRTENAEGTLAWVPLEQLPALPMWEGDRHFLPLVFDRRQVQFHGVMPYRDGKPLSWTFSVAGDTVAPDQTRDTLIAGARQLMARGDFKRVVDMLDVHRPAEWAVVDGQGARILRLLGQGYVRQGEWRAGRECLEQLRAVQRERPLLSPLAYAGALTDLLRCYGQLGMNTPELEIRQELAHLRGTDEFRSSLVV
jgi:8-oxo-dGTP diphosphatase